MLTEMIFRKCRQLDNENNFKSSVKSGLINGFADCALVFGSLLMVTSFIGGVTGNDVEISFKAKK